MGNVKDTQSVEVAHERKSLSKKLVEFGKKRLDRIVSVEYQSPLLSSVELNGKVAYVDMSSYPSGRATQYGNKRFTRLLRTIAFHFLVQKRFRDVLQSPSGARECDEFISVRKLGDSVEKLEW